jgi:RNA polymerase-binding transcription factor DksA
MWTADELKHVRDQLVAQLRELEHARAELEAEVEQPLGGEAGGGLSDVPIHPADLGTRLAEEDVALRVLAVEGHLQTEIVDALARLDENRYGVCERCGRRVTKERLRVLPYARYCMPCAREVKSTAPRPGPT